MKFQIVGELIDHLVKLGRNRALIVDVDGNTFPPGDEDIVIWNPTDKDSPVAIMPLNWID